jgi:hypothetical protein
MLGKRVKPEVQTVAIFRQLRRMAWDLSHGPNSIVRSWVGSLQPLEETEFNCKSFSFQMEVALNTKVVVQVKSGKSVNRAAICRRVRGEIEPCAAACEPASPEKRRDSPNDTRVGSRLCRNHPC